MAQPNNIAAPPDVDPNLILSSQVAQGMAVIGDRWAVMIIRDAYLGARQFEEFKRRSDISRGTLASRLKSLVDSGIFYRNPYQTSPTRYEYRLTDKGLDMYPVLLMAWAWETKWGRGSYLPLELTHTQCGSTMQPRLRCSHCHDEVRPQDIRYSAVKTARPAKKYPARNQRRSRVKEELGSMLDIVGDRWTSLVVAAAFFGRKRYDDIAASIGIATNILADRLKRLEREGVIQRRRYQDRPVRYAYSLTAKGEELARLDLASPPVWDGMAVADGRLYMTTRDGKVVCMGAP